MYDNGAIDRAGLERARRALVTLHNGLHTDEEFGAYFKEQVRRELVDRFARGIAQLSGCGLMSDPSIAIRRINAPARANPIRLQLAGVNIAADRGRTRFRVRSDFIDGERVLGIDVG